MKIPKFSKLRDISLTGLKTSALVAGLAIGSSGAMPQQLNADHPIGGADCIDKVRLCVQRNCGEYVKAKGSPTDPYTACVDGEGCLGFAEERCSRCVCCW